MVTISVQKLGRMTFNNFRFFGFFEFVFYLDFFITSKPKPHPLPLGAEKICFFT